MAGDPLAWAFLPIRVLEQFAARIAVHDARHTLSMYHAFALASGRMKPGAMRRHLRSLHRRAQGGSSTASRSYRPISTEERHALMGAMGVVQDG